MEPHEQLRADVAAHYERLGMSNTAARVLAFLMLQPDGSADAPTLAREIGVAKSSMSVALGTLERFGLVTRRRRAQSRRETFVLAENAFEAAFLSKLPALTAFLDIADRGLQLVPPDSDASRRLRRMRSFYSYMVREFPRMLEGWTPEV